MSEELTIQCLAHGTKCLHCGVICDFKQKSLRDKIAELESELEAVRQLKDTWAQVATEAIAQLEGARKTIATLES